MLMYINVCLGTSYALIFGTMIHYSMISESYIYIQFVYIWEYKYIQKLNTIYNIEYMKFNINL